jgi:hypothetical protein
LEDEEEIINWPRLVKIDEVDFKVLVIELVIELFVLLFGPWSDKYAYWKIESTKMIAF